MMMAVSCGSDTRPASKGEEWVEPTRGNRIAQRAWGATAISGCRVRRQADPQTHAS